MSDLLPLIIPELILLIGAAVLFVLGASTSRSARFAAPGIALAALLAALVASIRGIDPALDQADATHSVVLSGFSVYIKAISTGIASLFVLLAWPTSASGDSNRSIHFNTETGEYFALLLLAVAGMCVVSSANSLPTLFLGIELASIPTYIMVTMSRPHVAAQEAGIKYFFLGAASAALMLLGMSYLFGVTGQMRLDMIAEMIGRGLSDQPAAPSLLSLAVVLIVMSFLFKLAAAPLHFYAGDVYQGAATPVTAAISFIPKITGTVALLKILFVAGGGHWSLEPRLLTLLWVIAAVTMTVGNILGLVQYNVKRVLAYSSVAHSGYLLVGIVTAAYLGRSEAGSNALAATAFYMLAYGVMNAAAFGVLMMLPARVNQPALTAETYDDLAGTARKHPILGIAMTIGCMSLIGIPTTVGFFGKFYILKPAIESGRQELIWLAVITMLNATISAGYYLKIVVTMWSRTDTHEHAPLASERPVPVFAAVVISVIASVAMGVLFPLTASLFREARSVVDLILG